MSLTFLQKTRKEYFYFEEQRPRKQQLENTLLKSFGEEIHPLQVYFAWQIQSSTLLSCECGRARNYQVLLQKKVKYGFFTLQMEFTPCTWLVFILNPSSDSISHATTGNRKQLEGVCSAESNDSSKILCVSILFEILQDTAGHCIYVTFLEVYISATNIGMI